MAHCPEARKKGALRPAVRTASQPAQTLNVDLCLVPATHTLEQKLPAVSCSSGRLVAERPSAAPAEPSYPGQVFADPDRTYAQAMQAFAAAARVSSTDATSHTEPSSEVERRRAAKRALRQHVVELRAQRRAEREQRRQQDAAWRSLRAQRRADCLARQQRAPRPGARGTHQAQQRQWRELRAQRRAQLTQRNHEDAQWRAQRQEIRAQLGPPLLNAWIALLVITDNCTRQCLGVPVFVAGAKVTAEMVVAGLRHLLPDELQFVISDRGVHFTAQVFAQLAREEQFIHVLIARHRPESNGIAERFVRTLKEWLADKRWDSEQELASLLEQFRSEYNDRPHQGIAIPGLSPNEFAERIWLF